jgi:hypothetical protein
MAVNTAVPSKSVVPIALMLGSTVVRSLDHRRGGRVFPTPIVKNVTTNSSRENAAAIAIAPIIAGRIAGKTTCQKVRQ